MKKSATPNHAAGANGPTRKITSACLPRHPAMAYLCPALRIVDHLRRRFARFKLGAHFLQACS